MNINLKIRNAKIKKKTEYEIKKLNNYNSDDH